MKKLNGLLTLILFSVLMTSCTAEADTAPLENHHLSATGIAETTGMLANADVHTISSNAADSETDIDLDEITESAVTISTAGTYRIHGTLEGMVIVDAAKTHEVTLILDGADITSPTSAAVYVRKAGNVNITLADGRANTLANGGEYVSIDANNIDAVIFSKSDLTMGGTGSLTVTAEAGHGIVSKDTLEIYGGTYDITSASHGISAKDSLAIEDGTFTVTSGKDGIHAENSDDLTLGSVYIKNGTFSITSTGDGISASGSLQIDDGTVSVLSGGGAQNAEAHADDMMMGGGRGFFGWDWDNSSSTTETTETTDETAVTSFKALRSAGDMLLNGGTYTLSSAEDTIHTDANLTVQGGTYTLAAGDDGLHADLALVINDCDLTLTESYEGIEAKTIDVNGGILTVKASDDGFNASGRTATGWNAMAAEEGVYFKVSGGTIYLDADGDGLDSNGDFMVTGGEVYVAGPTNSANGALDYGGEAVAEGGTLIAVGAAGMAESFGDSSTQGTIIVNTGNQSAGSTVTLTDADGNVLAKYTFDKSFSNVVVTCPAIVDGGTYTLTAGTYTETITMDGLLYGEGMGGMFGGGGNRGGGGMNFGGKGDKKDRGQMTEDGTVKEVPNDVPTEIPELPEGETPVMPEGEVPTMPEGFDPGAMGEMGGERPEMPEGGFGGGMRGQMSESPQMPEEDTQAQP